MDLLTLVSTFVMQVGSRHVVMDLTDAQKKLVHQPGVQALFLFVMFYMATRSVAVAAAMLAAFYLMLHVWLNEHSRYSLLPRAWRAAHLGAAHEDPTRLYYENVAKLP